MFSHAYFLIDTSILSTDASVGEIITRILAFLLSRNESLTWNYEILDLGARQRAMTAQGKRRVSERKKPSAESIQQLRDALSDCTHQRKPALTSRRAVLDTLHERIMCLEADVEWGDPALMRSPTRNQGTRAWTDPMRLNESMSVRSHLYVLSKSPESLDALNEFVCGPGIDNTGLLDKLTLMRDGIIGNGIWENYARKRVSVGWIKPTKSRVVDMAPVDILVMSTFECCLEALGGCVMSAEELCNPSMPFSSIFEPLHRERTYPSWSRKFAHEISAVVDKFLTTGHDTQEQRTEDICVWTVQSKDPGSGMDTFRLRKIVHEPRRWLREGRLLRNFDLPEMVALAGEYQSMISQRQQTLADKAKDLATVCSMPMSVWPGVLRLVPSECMQCEVVADSRSPDNGLYGSEFIVAQNRSYATDGLAQTRGFTYFAIIPAGSRTALVYGLDTHAFEQALGISGSSSCEQTDAPSPEPFDPAWIEDWAWKLPSQMDIEPTDGCIIDTRHDFSTDDGIPCAASSPSKLCSTPTSASPDGGENSGSISASEDPCKHECAELEILDLHTWFGTAYLKWTAQPTSALDHAVSALESLFNSYKDDTQRDLELTKLRASVLLSSSSIDDAFSTDARDSRRQPSSAGDEGYIDSNAYMLQRQSVLDRVDDSDHRKWQLYECQLQILLHLFVVERMRTQDGKDSKEVVGQLVDTLHDLADQLCIWVSMDDLGGVFMPLTNPAAATDSGDTPNDPAAAFVGGPLVGRFAATLGDLVEDLRTQCGWVPQPSTDDTSLSDAEKTNNDAAGEGKRRKGTPRKINKSMSDRSEVIVDQRKRASNIMSGRKLARHLDELIGGTNNKSNSHIRSSGRRSSNIFPLPLPSKPTSSRRQSAQLKMPAHLIRQIKNEVVSTARTATKSHSATASSYGGNGRNAAGISSRSNTMRMNRAPSRPAIPSYLQESSSTPTLNGRQTDVCVVPEAQANKRQRTSGYVPLRSSAPTLFPQRNGQGMLCDNNGSESADRKQGLIGSSPFSEDVDIADIQNAFSRELFDALQDSDDGEGGIYIYDHSTH
ncbi:hypothetical protein H4R99_002071 [Coemansia sp. RSA 1722]|nr:hypothetical protein LPJ57_002237 [Coemansia sp. RSA 486]KAJ2233899.1 hypothetical protein IWW45_003831 [Coemansia sp. RSA 485]KAJ2604022.1 hypothetical protein H4R99_002071 [Coemansia sp. RSA 1722]